MEARNITVVSTSNQNKYVVNTDATTLRELKSALDAQGIDYAGMAFYEGLSHTELLTDDAVLPHDVPYKGNITNELVFMLTSPNKKIRSGAGLPEARVALYDAIQSLGLQDACVAAYGKNFTQCKNSELMSLVEDAQDAAAAGEVEHSCRAEIAIEAVDRLVGILYDEDAIDYDEAIEIWGIIRAKKSPDSPYTDEDIDKMFEFLG